jgi:GNAT superfamily N-acetyltransferase
VRLARIEDVTGITAAYVASCRAAYQGILPESFLQTFTIPDKDSQCRQSLEEATSRSRQIRVIERAGQVIGFAAVAPSAEVQPVETGDIAAWELEAIYILPALWGKGFGKWILEESLAGIAKHTSRCLLWVMERNTGARRFYETCGWTPDGIARTRTQGGITFREIRYGKNTSEPASIKDLP